MIEADLLKGFNKNPPATGDSIDAFSGALPLGYVEFLRCCNGGEGFIGESCYVIFWRVEELKEMNEAFGVPSFAENLLLFGSDGGGEGFAFDTRISPWKIVQVPFIGMGISTAETVADDFGSFLRHLYDIGKES
jgi:SMI1 / KNR4 family (SUKH-1)